MDPENDLFEPDGPATTPRPSVVIVHGGGWNVCDERDRHEPQMAEVLCGARYVRVSEAAARQ